MNKKAQVSTELIVKLNGSIEKSNFDKVKKEIIKQIENVSTDLKTDEDFITADQQVKGFSEIEKGLSKSKDDILKQASEIQALFNGIDELSEAARSKRLELSKLIKDKKEQIKSELVERYADMVANFKLDKGTDYVLVYGSEKDKAPFIQAIKGRSSLESMEKACTDVMNQIIEQANGDAIELINRRELIETSKAEYPALFTDTKALLSMPLEQLQTTVDARITTHKADEARRKAEKEAAEIRAKNEEMEAAEGKGANKPEAPTEPQPTVAQPKNVDAFDITLQVKGDRAIVQEVTSAIRNMFESRGVEVISGSLKKKEA